MEKRGRGPVFLENREQRTEYREQSTEYREQSTENRVQRTDIVRAKVLFYGLSRRAYAWGAMIRGVIYYWLQVISYQQRVTFILIK